MSIAIKQQNTKNNHHGTSRNVSLGEHNVDALHAQIPRTSWEKAASVSNSPMLVDTTATTSNINTKAEHQKAVYPISNSSTIHGVYDKLQPTSNVFDSPTEQSEDFYKQNEKTIKTNDTSVSAVAMLEQMVENQQMREIMHPYLPIPMRDKKYFEWMLSNSVVRNQLEELLAKKTTCNRPENILTSAIDAERQEAIRHMEVIGIKPNDLVARIMSDQELARAFSDPKIQNAIKEASRDHMLLVKHMQDPTIGPVLKKIQSVMMPMILDEGRK